jgi:hypothetical protein
MSALIVCLFVDFRIKKKICSQNFWRGEGIKRQKDTLLMQYKNEVLPGPYPGTLTVKLTKGKNTVLDDTGRTRQILLKHRFCCSFYGYAVTRLPSVDGGGIGLLHHMLMGNRPEGKEGDHCDGDTLNNRTYNLRWVSSRVNATNHNRPRRTNKTGVIGVSRQERRKRWRVSWQDENRAGKQVFFPDAAHGGRDSAFEIAKQYRCVVTSRLPVYVEAKKRVIEHIEKITEFK